MILTVERDTNTPLGAIGQAKRTLLSESNVVWFEEAYKLINRKEYQGGMPTLKEMRKVITIGQFHPLELLGFGQRALVREYAGSIEKAINDDLIKELRRNRLLYNRLIRWQNYLKNPEETPVPRELLSKAKRFHSKYEIINDLVSFTRTGEWQPSSPKPAPQRYEQSIQVAPTIVESESKPESAPIFPVLIPTEKRPNFASRMRQRCLERVESLKKLVSPVSRRGLVVAGLATATFFITTLAPTLAGITGINGADPKPNYPYREYVFEGQDPLFGDKSSLKGMAEGEYAKFNNISIVPEFNPHNTGHLEILSQAQQRDPWYRRWLEIFEDCARALNPNKFDKTNPDLINHAEKPFRVPDGESITASFR